MFWNTHHSLFWTNFVLLKWKNGKFLVFFPSAKIILSKKTSSFLYQDIERNPSTQITIWKNPINEKNHEKCFGCIYISQKYLGLSCFLKLGKIIAIIGKKNHIQFYEKICWTIKLAYWSLFDKKHNHFVPTNKTN